MVGLNYDMGLWKPITNEWEVLATYVHAVSAGGCVVASK